MALMNCPECGHQVSDQAFTCPHCGRPLRTGPLPERLRQESRALQSLTMGCGCMVILVVLAIAVVIGFLMTHGFIDWKSLFTYTIQRST